MSTDPSSSSTKKRGAADESLLELVEDRHGLKRRSCASSSSPLPISGSAHESTKARNLLQELYDRFMAEKVQEVKLEIRERMPHSINNSLTGEEESQARAIVDGLVEEKRAGWLREFRQLLNIELDGIAMLQLNPLPPTPRNYKLRLCSKIKRTMYHKNEIKSTDNKVLKIEICDAYSNTVISNDPIISSAMVELFLKEKGSETPISSEKTRKLISFNHLQCRLQHGIGHVEGLTINPSGYWKSNCVALGVKVIDKRILEKIGTIEEASSEFFRVLTKRSKDNEKHYPPNMQSEIWRLFWVNKKGQYHTTFSLEELNIKTVGDFLRKYHEMSSPTLEEFLESKMHKKKLPKWDEIVKHAKTCKGTDYYQTTNNNNDNAAITSQQRPNSNRSSKVVHNHQNQRVQDNNNNLVRSGIRVNYDQNTIVVNFQNESFDQIIMTRLEEANYPKEDYEVGKNAKLPRTGSPNQQWIEDTINFDNLLDSPSNNWAEQMILESSNPYGIDYRVEQSQELGP